MTDEALLRVLLGVFVFLHGLVHLPYAGQCARLWELKPDWAWPDGSWAFSRRPGDRAARRGAVAVFLLAAGALAVGGVGLISGPSWSRPLVAAGAALSVLSYLLLWNATKRRLLAQGALGIVIDIVVVVTAVLFL